MGETCWRIRANCVLVVTGAEAKEACRTEQLYGGLEEVIEGRGPYGAAPVVATRPRGGLGFLLIYAQNAFNEENRTSILWEVRFELPSGMRFTFNCYCHWATLVIREGDGTGHFLFHQGGSDPGIPTGDGGLWAGNPPPHPIILEGPPRNHPDLVRG